MEGTRTVDQFNLQETRVEAAMTKCNQDRRKLDGRASSQPDWCASRIGSGVDSIG
jgi:hypothetical protein